MAASSVVSSLFVLFLTLGAAPLQAARLPPGSSPIVETCKSAPYPDSCVGELGQRLLDIQTAIASVSDHSARIAGAPGQVDPKALVAVALDAAAEAGSVAAAILEGKLPGFNTSVPDFQKCIFNCTVTMKSAMKKIHGASAACKSGAHNVAKTLASGAIADISSCTLSCKDLKGDVLLILQQSLVEFQKMLQLAVVFISKLKPQPGPAPPAPAMP
jgi:pectinesterase inhibitor-like protein